MSFGSYSTPPIVSSVNTAPTEGTLPPFPENEAVTDNENKLTPSWRRWFAKQRSWLTDKGAYKPTNFTFTAMGAGAATTGNPVFQWWKQGNIVQVYFDLQLTGVTSAGGNVLMKPLPFDPTVAILTNGASPRPLFAISCMALTAVWSALPCYVLNDKSGTVASTFLHVLNIPVSTTRLVISGTYITDN